MTPKTRYVHTSLVARDWRRLAAFYTQVFHCELLLPERNEAGDGLDRGTGVPGVRIRGVHLRLPGGGPDGPTLEIYSYEPELEAALPMPNRPGFGHIAFEVQDVAEAYAEVQAAGGDRLGEPVVLQVPGAGTINFAYVRDPEGNVIELQRWL